MVDLFTAGDTMRKGNPATVIIIPLNANAPAVKRLINMRPEVKL